MQEENRNIYRSARRSAGYTQEAAAELLALSVESIRAYETGIRVPMNDTVERMVEVYNAQHLAYQHLKATNALMSRVVPPLEKRTLMEAAIRFTNRVNRILKEDTDDRVLELSEDGCISQDEAADSLEIAEAIQELVQAGLELGMLLKWKED